MVVTVRSRTPSRAAISRAVSPSAATASTSLALRQQRVEITPLDLVRYRTDGRGGRSGEHHLALPARMIDETNSSGSTTLVDESIRADEERTADAGGVGVRADREHRVER
jgi:hypothetical protein